MFVSGRVGVGENVACWWANKTVWKEKEILTEGSLSNIPFWVLISFYTAWKFFTVLTRNSHNISHQLLWTVCHKIKGGKCINSIIYPVECVPKIHEIWYIFGILRNMYWQKRYHTLYCVLSNVSLTVTSAIETKYLLYIEESFRQIFLVTHGRGQVSVEIMLRGCSC